MVTIIPLGEHEICVFAKFALTQFILLHTGPKEGFDTVSKFHVSDKPVFLYSINQKTGNCKLLEQSGDIVEVEITDPKHGSSVLKDETYLLPLNEHNSRILDSMFGSCGTDSLQHRDAILPMLTQLLYFNIGKYKYQQK